jgi:hypothetical protein
MKPRQPRVPVRWGFVLMMGIVVLGVVGAAAYYGSAKLSADPEARKSAISFVKRTIGH